MYNLPTCFKPDTVNKTVTREEGREREREEGKEGGRGRERELGLPRSQTQSDILKYYCTPAHPISVFLYLVLTLFQLKHTVSSSMEPAAPINPYEGVPQHDRMR